MSKFPALPSRIFRPAIPARFWINQGRSDTRLAVHHLVVTQSNAAAALAVYGVGSMRVYDNLLYGNPAVHALVVGSSQQAPANDIVVLNNTVASNSGTGLVLTTYGLRVPIALFNNILWNNSGNDLELDAAQAFGFRNIIKVASPASPFLAGSTQNSSANPLLDANFKPGAGSPALNGGALLPTLLPVTDLAGNQRRIGSAPDIGAYESIAADDFTGAASLIVTNANNTGAGSMRQAIATANASGKPARLRFQMPSCPQTMQIDTPLPAITVPMTIEGYTQAGSARNTLSIGDNAKICVVIASPLFGTQTAQALSIGAAGATLDISGIAFSGFSSTALNLRPGPRPLGARQQLRCRPAHTRYGQRQCRQRRGERRQRRRDDRRRGLGRAQPVR